MSNLFVYVNDGKILSQGRISDISRDGLAMTDLSRRLNANVKTMILVISGKEIDFRMRVRPRWFTHGGIRKTIGTQIIDVPFGWMEFVMSHEPVSGNDKPDEILI